MSAFSKLAKVIKEHPWSVIIVCFLLTVGLGFGLFFLKGHVTYQSLLPSDFPSVKALSALRENFGGISYEYVLIRAPSVTDNEIVQFLVGLEDALKEEPQFNKGQLATRVNSVGEEVPVVQDYVTPFAAVMQQEIAKRGIELSLGAITNNAVKIFTGKDFKSLIEQDYLSNPLAASQVVGRFITPDGKAALVMLKDGPDLTEKQQVQLGADIEKYFKGKLSLLEGVEVSVSGDAILARDFNEHIKNKTLLLFGIAIIFVVLTLFIAFRRTSDTVLPVLVMLLGALWTFGFTGWIGIEYSVAVIAVMPLLLGTALTFVVPFVARYYEEAESSHRAVQAVGLALMAVGVAIFLAAITNVFGFLVFEFSVLPALRDFGLTCAIGTGFVFFLSVVLLPAVLVVRDRVFDKRAEAGKSRRRNQFDGLSMSRRRGFITRGIDHTLEFFARLSIRRSTIVISVFAVLILVGLIQLRGLKTDSDLRKLVPRELPGIKADFELEKYFGGQQQDVIMVTGDVMSAESLKAMADLEASIAGRGGDGLYTRQGVTGLPDALAAANNGKLPATREEAQQALANAEASGGYVIGGLLSADGKSALVTLNASGAQTTDVVDRKIGVMKKNADQFLPSAGLKYQLGGITPLTKDMTKNLIPTETWSSALSLLLCALILVIIFRSLAYGLITLTVAIAGIAAEIGFLNIVNWPLDIVTSLVSALVIGVGVNFGILFTHRYIQEREQGGHSASEAIGNTMSNLGRANVIAAIATVAAFVIVMFSGIVPLRRFGGVTAVAISACLITSLTLMPALLLKLSGHREAHHASEPSEAEPEPQVT